MGDRLAALLDLDSQRAVASDSGTPDALRDAALSNGALTEITRALSPSTRDGAAPKAALAWHPTKPPTSY